MDTVQRCLLINFVMCKKSINNNQYLIVYKLFCIILVSNFFYGYTFDVYPAIHCQKLESFKVNFFFFTNSYLKWFLLDYCSIEGYPLRKQLSTCCYHQFESYLSMSCIDSSNSYPLIILFCFFNYLNVRVYPVVKRLL